jgi:nucleotide-binding universal stress UspA family protein
MMTFKNVLVATDFSEPSVTALEYGRAIARTFHASLHVLHVVERVMMPGTLGEVVPFNAVELAEQLRAVAHEQLEETVGEDDRRELDATPVLLTSTAPAEGIVDYARRANVELIVMGTHGRGGWSHLMMGSVAEKVVRTAPCPVLTVRHPEREFVKPDALQVTEHARS